MCTVSWIAEEGGYQLFSNRDEKHARKPALPPAVREQRGIRFITPIDGDHGGSWIGVNQYGLSLCLLNLYQNEAISSGGAFEYTSRGLLLLRLIDCCSRAQTQSRIEQMNLARFQPFTLLALEAERPALLIRWTGKQRSIVNDDEAEMPLISSSHDLPGVISSRRQFLDHLLATSSKLSADLLQTFHTSHFPAASAYSPCMHRDDARTVSFSRVRVAGSGIEYFYHSHSPCTISRAGHSFEITLERRMV